MLQDLYVWVSVVLGDEVIGVVGVFVVYYVDLGDIWFYCFDYVQDVVCDMVIGNDDGNDGIEVGIVIGFGYGCYIVYGGLNFGYVCFIFLICFFFKFVRG